MRKIGMFLLGSTIGLLSLLLSNLTGAIPLPFFVLTFFFGSLGSIVTDVFILKPICRLDTGDLCRGLGLDGGPLAWIEWTGIFVGVAVGYGIIFVFLYSIVKYINK